MTVIQARSKPRADTSRIFSVLSTSLKSVLELAYKQVKVVLNHNLQLDYEFTTRQSRSLLHSSVSIEG